MAIDIPAITFLKAHEKLVIVVLVLVFGVFFTYKGLDAVQSYHQGKETKLEAQLEQTQAQVKTAQDAAVAAQAQVATAQQAAAQDKAASAAIISALSAQNAALNQSIITRDKQTQTQQQADLSASIPDLGKRFIALVPNVNPADIKVAPDASTVTIGKDTAEKTVAQLELIPQLQQDKKDLQVEVDNGTKEVASIQKALDSESQYADNEAKLIATEEKITALLQTQIDQSDKVCQQKIDVEKGKGRKLFLKGLGIGTVLGAVFGFFAHGV